MGGYTLIGLTKRLVWDIRDVNERKYLAYFFISGLPGLAGDRMRGRFVSKKSARCGKDLIVQSGSRFRSMERLVIGDNVVIGYDNFIQALGGVSLGDNVMTGPGVKIWSVNHNYMNKDELIRNQGQTAAPVAIGNDVWLAANVFISPGVTLPDGCVVASGAVVGVKAYKPYSILAGNPARAIGFRGTEETDNVKT